MTCSPQSTAPSSLRSAGQGMPPRPRNSHLLEQVKLGDEIEVWWPQDSQYYSGVVGCRLPSGRHRILYDDGEVEDLRLATEQWRFKGRAAQRVLAAHSSPPLLNAPPPPLNVPPLPLNSSSQDAGFTDSTSTAKTVTIKKRGRPKGRKTLKKPSSAASAKTADSLKVRKRQRSSSTAIDLQSLKTTKSLVPSHEPLPLEVDSVLIDAAPLGASTVNSFTTSQPSTSASKPSKATISVAANAAPSVNSSEKIDVLQVNASPHRRISAQITSTAPAKSVIKPLPLHSPTVLGYTPSTTASVNHPSVSANSLPSIHPRVPSASATNQQSARKRSPSSSPGTQITPSQTKACAPPPTNQPQQEPESAETDKQKEKLLGKNVTSKKGTTSTPVLHKEDLRGSRPGESKTVETSTSRPDPTLQSNKPNSSKTPRESTPHLTNGHATPNHVIAKIPTLSGAVGKGLKASSKKKMNRSSEGQDTRGNCSTQAKLPTASDHKAPTGNVPGKRRPLENKPKGSLQPAPRRCAESAPSPKTTTAATKPVTALMARVTHDRADQKDAASSTKSRSPSTHPNDSRSDTSPMSSKGTPSPRTNIDGVVKRGPRPNQDAKGTSKVKTVNLPKFSAKRSISKSKSAKSAVQKQAVSTLSPRPPTEPNTRKTGMNPDDGSDIIADVNVPRKPKGGPASPMLRSPLGGVRHLFTSPSKGVSLSGGMGLKPMNIADLKNFSLQQALPAASSVRGDRSPLVKGERSGSKLGPFQPTKRRSGILRPGTATQAEQQSPTNAVSRSSQSTNPRITAVIDKRRRLTYVSKPSRSETQGKALGVSASPQSIPVGVKIKAGEAGILSSIPDSEQVVSSTKRPPSSEKKMGSTSDVLKYSIATSPRQAKNLTQPAVENSKESVDRSKTGTAVKNLPASAKASSPVIAADSSQRQPTAPRMQHRDGVVNEKENITVPGTSSATENKSANNAVGEGEAESGLKRTVSDQGKDAKRRKLDSGEKQDLTQAARATALPLVRESRSHVPQTSPQPSSLAEQHPAIKQPDPSSSKGTSISVDRKMVSLEPNPAGAIQAKRPPGAVIRGDYGDKPRDERAGKQGSATIVVPGQCAGSPVNKLDPCESTEADATADDRASGKTQREPTHSLEVQSTARRSVSEGAPSVRSGAKATLPTVSLEPSQSNSSHDGPTAKGLGTAPFSSQKPGTHGPCVKTVARAHSSEIADIASQEPRGCLRPRGEKQPVQRVPDPPLPNVAPDTSQKLQSRTTMGSGANAQEFQLSSAIPRSFARVRSRQVAGSALDNGNPESTPDAAQDPDQEAAGLPLSSLMDIINEANQKSLQSQLAPLSSRFENRLADNNRFLTNLQGQLETATRTMKSLRDDLVVVRAAVSDVPSLTDIKTYLERHAQETRRVMTDEMKAVTSELKENLREYLSSELANSMKNVAAQIQKDSVMLISKAFDNAIGAGLVQDHPRAAEDNGENDMLQERRGEPMQVAGNETNSNEEVANSGVNSDDVPLAHRFGLKAGTALGGVAKGNDEQDAREKEADEPTGNQTSAEKDKTTETPAVPQDHQNSSRNSMRDRVSPSRAAKISGQAAPIPPDLPDKAVKGCQADSLGTKVVRSVSKNSASGLRVDHASLGNPRTMDEKGAADVKMIPLPRRAQRENYEQLTVQVRVLLARCAVEWFLSGGCRDFAPSNERTTPVSTKWVNESALRCLEGIVKRLEHEDTFEGAMKDLGDSVGLDIETCWLLQGPTVSNISNARSNYTEWDPNLMDFEWESEKRVLADVSEKLIRSEQSLIETGEIFEDLLLTAMRCVQHASAKNATKSTK